MVSQKEEVKMQQNDDIRDYFEIIFNNYIPETIVEFGTGSGRFIDIINKILTERNIARVIHTFDIEDRRTVTNDKINYHIIDIFKNEEIVSRLLGNGLLLCDNGDKIREVKIFAKYLQPGDVLMAHDYAYSKKTFNDFKYWRTCEITFQDIINSITDFSAFHQTLMIKAGWLSIRKK